VNKSQTVNVTNAVPMPIPEKIVSDKHTKH